MEKVIINGTARVLMTSADDVKAMAKENVEFMHSTYKRTAKGATYTKEKVCSVATAMKYAGTANHIVIAQTAV